jgi:hypothetical protein
MKGDKIDIPQAIAESHEMMSSVLTMLEDGEDNFGVLKKGCPLFKPTSSDCTGEYPRPDAQSARDAAIGGAVRWTAGKAWTALPHVYRTLIVAVGGATVGGVSWPSVKAVILSILAHL